MPAEAAAWRGGELESHRSPLAARWQLRSSPESPAAAHNRYTRIPNPNPYTRAGNPVLYTKRNPNAGEMLKREKGW